MRTAQVLVRSKPKGKRMTLKKTNFVAEVVLTGHHEEGDKVVGSAKIEQLPGGHFIAHINASGMTAETLRRGFSLGPFTVAEENDGSTVQLEE